MTRKSITLLTLITLLSFAVVVVLYALSEEPFSYQQNFTRIHHDAFITPHHAHDLKRSDYYIAGTTSNQIYFGNEKDSLTLYATDYAFQNIDTIQLHITPVADTLQLNDSRIEVDSPYFYVKLGTQRMLYQGELNHWRAIHIFNDITYFKQAVATTAGTFAYVAEGGTAADKTRTNLLCTISPFQPFVVRNDILKGYTDGYYSTLGALRYSKTLRQLVYVYFYRDEFIIMDAQLNPLHHATSIGTVMREHIKPLEVSKGVYTLASTSAVVNRNAQVYDSLLFIYSNLMSMNEDKSMFDSSNVIDVYNLVTQQYLFSFFIPDYKQIKLTSFYITGEHLITKHANYITTYSLNYNIPKIFTDSVTRL